jgi:hypothetical protein
MSKRFALYHAINNNQFPNNRGAQYNVSDLRAYLIKKQASYLSKLDVYDANLIKFSKVLPNEYATIINYNQLPYWMTTGWRMSSFPSIVSNLKSFYAEVTSYNMTRFETEWPTIYQYTYYFTNNLAVQLNQQIFNPILSANDQYVQGKTTLLANYRLGCLLTLGLVLIGIFASSQRVNYHKISFLRLLIGCSQPMLDTKHKNNRYGSMLLQVK